MKNNIEVFLLKTDISDKKIPFIAAPCAYINAQPVVLPVIEQAVEHYHSVLGTSIDDTFVISLRRHFSTREIRTFISLYFKNNKTFLLFICDSIERSELVLSTIKTIYGMENISRFTASGTKEDF